MSGIENKLAIKTLPGFIPRAKVMCGNHTPEILAALVYCRLRFIYKDLFKGCLLCLLLSTGSIAVRAQQYADFTTKTPLKEGDVLIVGFMGGRESWHNHRRGVRKLALKLRAMNLPGVHTETVENKKRELAVDLIQNAFDRDRNGWLDEQERASARVILYGQSFGGAAVVKFARQLKQLGIPVLLTVQVDSIGRGDKVIPSNVALAANLFQRDGLIIKGEREIRPEDPTRTTIIGNFKFDYSRKKIDLAEVSWLKRLLQAAHTKMDHDPEVWAVVENCILNVMAALQPPSPLQSHLESLHPLRLCGKKKTQNTETAEDAEITQS